jgi:TonB-linked SusC/RagA family outer membrane protein
VITRANRSAGVVVVALLLQLSPVAAAQQPDTASRADSVSKANAAPRLQNGLPPMQRVISLNASNVRLETVLDEIDRQAGIELQYTARVVPVNRRITVHLTRVPVATALDSVLVGTGVHVVVTPTGRVMLVSLDTTPVDTGLGVLGGLVTDSLTGRPVNGAVITIEGSSITATTTDSGLFILSGVRAGRRVVHAKRIGFVPAERTVLVVDSQLVRVDILLNRAPAALDAVVVTATGSQLRRELGNDITILKADSIVALQPVSSVTELLATRVPGLTVEHSSGAPGDPARLRLRGAASITETNDPIIYVDGARLYYDQSASRSANLGSFAQGLYGNPNAPSPLDQIDPNSVETIEVFKGPSATTMYGPDAANGVIVITTKKGRAGPPRWTASVVRGMTVMPGAYPAAYFRFGSFSQFVQQGGASSFCQPASPCTVDSLVRFQALNDPATTVLGRGNNTTVTAGVAGGASALTYAFNASVDNELGLLKLPEVSTQQFTLIHGSAPPDWMLRPQTLNRWSLTSQLNAQLGPLADVSLSTFVTHENQQRSDLESALGAFMGSYFDRATRSFCSPSFPTCYNIGGFYTRTTDEATNFTNALTLNWRPRKWLTASANAGLNVITRQDEALEPNGLAPGSDSTGAVGFGHGSSLVKTVNVYATATAPLPLGFRAATSFGANYVARTTSDLQAHGGDLPPGVTEINGALNQGTSNDQTDVASFGWFVEPRINNNRFFVDAGLRLDGGTTYGTHVSLAAFPKVAVSYLVSDEPWFPAVMKPVVNTLRLRVAYGHAGVEPGISDKLRVFQQSSSWLDGGVVTVAQLGSLGNTQLQPERSTEIEGGFDAELLDDRLSIGLTSYRKMRYQALMSVPVAPSVYGGILSVERNVGTIRNTGFELTLGTELVRTDLFDWRIDLNGSRNHNLVVATNGGAPILLQGGQRVIAGYPLFGFWARPILGYADVDHDGVIGPSDVLIGDSAVFMGTAEPNYEVALHTTATFLRGALTIGGSLDYQDGLTQLNQVALNNLFVSRGLNDPGAPLGEQAAAVAAFDGNTNYGFFEAVSTLRLTSLSITYRLPVAMARQLGATGMSVSVQGTNLGLWTNYRGKDPDVNAFTSSNGGLVDTGILPVPRLWQLRMNVAF